MKVIKSLLLIALVCVCAFALWYWQPWSKYSPAKIASFEDPDKLTWNMQNMGELVPYRVVKAGQKLALQESLSALELSYQFEGKQKTLEQFLNESTTGGLLVIKDGVVVHEQYRQNADRNTLFTSWSVAKSFVATTIAIAVKEGAINSFDDTVETYAPQFSGTDYGTTKIGDLMAMSSGIDFEEDYQADKSDIRRFFFESFILKKNPDELLKPYSRDREPMSDFHYISSNSHVLSAVLRGVYNKPLAEIISEKLWQPLGMEGDASWLQHVDGDGQGLGYCCLNSRVRDYARFGQFLLQAIKGEGLGVDVLPEGWVQTLRVPASEHHKPGGDNYSGRGYSQHFWLPIDAPGVFFASGIYGQFIWVDADNDLVIARTSADPEWTPRYPESEAVMKAITAYYAAQ